MGKIYLHDEEHRAADKSGDGKEEEAFVFGKRQSRLKIT